MTDQLDLAAGRAGRDEALERVEVHADPEWRRRAKRALWTVIRARPGAEITTDDIDCPEPREPRAWGPIMLAAQRAGFLVNTGRTRQSARPQCHARPKTVWHVVVRGGPQRRLW